ncbi:MAG: hypothetical protein CEO22_313 [Candidatus Berkelbacteria bacterium Gr01-1014_85]|uniref:Uncharacterized protein n=1 Tax=Candidatus Berkelbacteria bacterium Gr01-1014_85 TaxID=2017150 RepID=A0A554JBY1_9BACT|nr:MAG: hypothetical protein CEO22_313 [Candidatus Berkelbacteria bacterium Gr01-1014_85]
MKAKQFWIWCKRLNLGVAGLAIVMAIVEQIIASSREDILHIQTAEALANLAIAYLIIGLISHEIARRYLPDA